VGQDVGTAGAADRVLRIAVLIKTVGVELHGVVVCALSRAGLQNSVLECYEVSTCASEIDDIPH
jgi:hypothetical protein